VPFPIITPELNLRPDGGGRLVLHALDLNATVGGGRYEPDGAYRREVLQRLRNVLRGGEHARIDKVSLGLRSLPADGHTVAGSDTSGHIYILATHSGVTLGPLLGRLAAQEILHDELAPELADYRPQRFQDATVFPPLAPARQPGEQ
jgi:glycine/D-amino acid oxidase-like deaminating enzyme